MKLLNFALLLGGLSAMPAAAQTTIVYGPSSCLGGCVDYSAIDLDWGSTPEIGVTNRGISQAGPGGVPFGALLYWGGAYSNSAAAWNGSPSFGAAEVVFTPISRPVRLISVDFGGWPNAAVSIDWFVYSADLSSLLASGNLTTNPVALTTVPINVSSATPIRFQFSGTWEAGIQNVTYGAVPEPSSWALMIAGFGLVGASIRRRRLAAA